MPIHIRIPVIHFEKEVPVSLLPNIHSMLYVRNRYMDAETDSYKKFTEFIEVFTGKITYEDIGEEGD